MLRTWEKKDTLIPGQAFACRGTSGIGFDAPCDSAKLPRALDRHSAPIRSFRTGVQRAQSLQAGRSEL